MSDQGNALLEFVDRYQHDPVLFVREVLGVERIYAWQETLLGAYARGERRISVRSGHGVGKSAVASWICCHHLLTRFPQKTVITAPSSSQLYDALFAEIKMWLRRTPPAVQALVEIKADRIELTAAPESSFISARTSRADQPEAMQGVHAENVLLLADEASGIPEKVFEAGSGSMSGENAITLLLGNPNYSSGFFYETHTKLADRWFTMHVSCEGAEGVSRDYVEDQARKYGEQSNAYRIRVLGEFPLADDDTVIPFGLLDSARKRDITPTGAQPDVWGLDVARFGSDSTTLCRRRGNALRRKIEVYQGLDTMQVVGVVKTAWDECAPTERPLEILVDAIGLGAGVADRLRELGLPCRGINVSESPAMKGKYRNLRAELWFAMRDWFERRDCSLPDDEELINELAMVKYKFTANGKIQIESKDDMKRRGFKSPDRADALMLTFAGEAALALYGATAYGWNQPLKRGIASLV